MKLNDLKKKGSSHYKGEKVEPIDRMKEGGILWDFARGNIIKYAYRNRWENHPLKEEIIQDMNKIAHYAEMIKTMEDESSS